MATGFTKDPARPPSRPLIPNQRPPVACVCLCRLIQPGSSAIRDMGICNTEGCVARHIHCHVNRAGQRGRAFGNDGRRIQLWNENSITVRIGKTGTPCAHGRKTFSGRATKALGNHPIVPLREVVVKEDRHVLFESRRRFRSGRIITRNDIHSDCQARLRLGSLDQFLD